MLIWNSRVSVKYTLVKIAIALIAIKIVVIHNLLH